MDKISPETRAIYELLRADSDTALDNSLRERNEHTIKAIDKLGAKLDQLSGRIEDVKLSLGVDIDELRTGLEKAGHSEAGAPSTSKGAGAVLSTPPRSGSVGLDGHRVNNDHRGTAQTLCAASGQRYAIRAIHYQKFEFYL